MKGRRLEILGILTMAVFILVLTSLLGYHPNEDPGISPNVQVENPMGILGVWIAYYFIKMGVGYIAFLIPLVGIVWGWWFFSQKQLTILGRFTGYLLGAVLLASTSIGLVEIWRDHPIFKFSGLGAGLLAQLLHDFLGAIGAGILLVALWLVLIRGYFSLSFYTPFKWFSNHIKKRLDRWRLLQNQKKKETEKRSHTENLLAKIDAQRKREMETISPKEVMTEPQDAGRADLAGADQPGVSLHETEPVNEEFEETETPAETTETKSSSEGNIDENLAVGEIVKEEEINLDDVKERQAPRRKYQLPSPDILNQQLNIQGGMSREELVDRANFLTQSLQTFGVEGKVVNVSPGPVITLFEVEPAEGVRVNKFVALSDDLARVMEASRVRVIAPIPGKSSVGIEIPNRNPDIVYFKSIINSEKFATAKSKLALAIGKTTSGEIAILDLTLMPHLLIAGTTGSGKSVCINTILASLLYRASPNEVKFVIIDPKKVEMTLYRALEGYHMLGIENIDETIVTTPENSVLALRAVEREMGHRYDVMAEEIVRNIDEYNARMRSRGEPIMPYIIIVIDELADLMMLNAKDVEAPIARLAQLARAVGIHLVVATQRPSVDVITGVIKANFPSRIAFQVATKIDSRTIIDQSGAEKLIGRGDMLYLGHGSSEPIRLHNAFLSLEEIEAVMEHIAHQPKAEELVLPGVREATVSAPGVGGNMNGFDDLFDEAVRLVVIHQQGSISLLQRRLKIGYSRAARLIDEMEQAGIVGPFTGSKAREVLVDESYLDSLKP
ncbi:MAG: DNA translocase FtsK [Fidelibacterota bacterium]